MSPNWVPSALGWPSADEVLSPKGTVAAIYAQQATEKIGNAIALRPDGDGIRVGVLASDPEATEAPLAIVCQFPKKVSSETLQETQKLAWNFGRSLLLITIEPHIIRKWTCCEPPTGSGLSTLFDTPEIDDPIHFDPDTEASLSEQAAHSIHWVSLLSGEFFKKNETRFKPEKRADQLLLNNLKVLRQKLVGPSSLLNDNGQIVDYPGLDSDISHDLLARIIFIQFLFDRKDSEGKAALNTNELRRLCEEEHVLTQVYSSFAEILSDYEDAYALFRWLNSKFNGDLFPGKGSQEEQEAAWTAERNQVRPDQLDLLARFVGGTEEMIKGQLSLWPSYCFDAIPLDVISTIYEQFVKTKGTGTGVHYTPSHVADLVLDLVLPWEGREWNLKILDPSCGSGVFLVKAFQRLVHRWKQAHAGCKINGEVLTALLEQNVFGVDLDPHAVRVASFSLYLALCDEIDPRDYWKEVHFPILRGRRLMAADFFSEEFEKLCASDERLYDLVIGNPPWGENTITEAARIWGANPEHTWPISYKDIGPLFLAKALTLTKSDGYVGLLQPSTLLYKLTAQSFRNKLFREAHVEEVINFAALRSFLFRDATMPACAFVLRKSVPNGEAFWYSCPKPLRTQEDAYRIIIEPQDIHQVFPDEVAETPWLWSTLLWGGRRDIALVRTLSRNTNLAELEKNGIIRGREGIIRGDQQKTVNQLLQKPFLESSDLLDALHIFIEADALPKNENPRVHSRDSTNFNAFELPQAIVRQSLIKEEGRFRAALVASNERTGGILCSQSYLSFHAEEDNQPYLEAACLTYNSVLATYYLLLTSGRFAMNRGEPEATAFRSVPLPQPYSALLDGIETVEDIDKRVNEAFGFKEAEWLLIEDLAKYTLPDYRGGDISLARYPTTREVSEDVGESIEPELMNYCATFCRVIQAAYGRDKYIGAVIFSESETTQEKLPVRMVSIYLNVSEHNSFQVETMRSDALRQQLTTLYKAMLSTQENKHSFYQRSIRTYDTIKTSISERGICINLIKPDQIRYWTRSMALRDADAVAADLLIWSGGSQEYENRREAAIA